MSRSTHRSSRKPRKARNQRNLLILIAGVSAIAATILLIVAGGLSRTDDVVSTAAVSQRSGRILGSPTAPVVVFAWEDFQCPVCKTANATVVDRLIREYVQSGQVQFHYRYFSFLGQESIWAAQAAEVAAEQGLFWEFHDALFAAQAGENRGAFSKQRLKALAERLGLDVALFDDALNSGKYSQVVELELEEGKRLGVKGTPTFFVDGVQVSDWRDFEQFRDLIERHLASRR
jgi:protein-disulfide isomerase